MRAPPPARLLPETHCLRARLVSPRGSARPLQLWLRAPLSSYSRRYFTMAGILFEDIFDVKDIDPEGKKFDRGKMGVEAVGDGARGIWTRNTEAAGLCSG